MTPSTSTPYFDLIPKDPATNLRWRLAMRKEALHDKHLQAIYRQAAFQDVLFFFSAFCWVYEPRLREGVKEPQILPFIPWPHQVPAIKALDENCGVCDVALDKSRGEGATWMYLMVILRRWLRDPLFSAGLVSRNEDAVDKKDDPDCLMWKLDWQLKMLPFWMRPHFERSQGAHSLTNKDLGSTIVGYSATGDVASGGRKTVFAMDELAKFPIGQDYAAMDSTQHVTDCRFIISTFKGDAGAYYDCIKEDHSERSVVKVVLDWKDNPTRNQCVYRVVKGVPKAHYPEDAIKVNVYAKANKQDLDTLARRGFLKEGQVRSPWYDRQCLRPGATPRGIAQELDRNPHGTVAKIFDGELLERMLHTRCRPPIAEGRFVYDGEQSQPMGFTAAANGELKLWVPIGMNHEVPFGNYCIGADISAGTAGSHSSNSSLFIGNRFTGEQAAEFTSNRVGPARFARLAVAMCRWFHDAFLIWEANGPVGAAFTKELVDELFYPNIYYRETEIEGLHRKTQRPGYWMNNDEARLRAFESMSIAMDDGAFIPRSKAMVDECRQYQWHNGSIIHQGSRRTDDDSAKGKAHGDRAVAAALFWIGCKDQPVAKVAEQEESFANAPVGSMAWLLQQHDARKQKDPWTGEVIELDYGELVGTGGGRDSWT